jgi:hypothetical protein
VLLDWTNARARAAETDVALTWLVLAAADLGHAGLRAAVGGRHPRDVSARVARALRSRARARGVAGGGGVEV